jgi:hypothetical protein
MKPTESITDSKKEKEEAVSQDLAEEQEINFEEYVRISEEKYDQIVTHLLKAIAIAEKNKDSKKLKAAKEVSDTWVGYFESLEELLADLLGKETPSNNPSNQFVSEQITFFKKLSGEIENKLAEF